MRRVTLVVLSLSAPFAWQECSSSGVVIFTSLSQLLKVFPSSFSLQSLTVSNLKEPPQPPLPLPVYPSFLIRKTLLLSIRSLSLWKYPVSEEHEPFSSQHATVSAGLLVDTNLDTSVPDTYRAPPVPVPYETYAGHPPALSGNRGSSGSKSEVALQSFNTDTVEDVDSGSALETKIKDLEVDEKAKMGTELVASKEAGDENANDIIKSIEPMVPPVLDEEDSCPTCLEEYDAENPKIITKCDHHFHLACILEWMERSDTCPVCSQEMVFSPAIGV